MGQNELKFERIYESNYPKVMRLCLGYVNGDYDTARDLAQEVFIKVWDNLGKFREESSVATWIYRITVNTCLGLLRKTNKKIKNIHLESVSMLADDDSTIKREQMLSTLYTCISKLSETNRAIILLELEDLPQNEIAEIMGISHEAIRTRIHRIKNQLIKCSKNDKF